MTNARIERMTRELHAEPATQFFEHFFRLIGLLAPKTSPAPKAGARSEFKLSYK